MEMTVTQTQGAVPITILKVEGKLDGSNYHQLIARAEELYEAGGRDLLLDLSQVSFISSAGISALHRVALLFGGKPKTELEEGWAAFRAIDRDRDLGRHQHVKLLNPSVQVKEVLELAGFIAFFEIHTEIPGAVASFK